MVDKIRGARPDDRRVSPEIRDRCFPAGARRPLCVCLPEDDARKGPALVREERHRLGPVQVRRYETGQSIRGERNPDYYHKGLPYLDGFKGIFAPKQVTRVEASAATARRSSSAAFRRGARRAGRRARRQDHGAGERLELRRHHHDQSQEEAIRRCPRAPRSDPGDRPLGNRAGTSKIAIVQAPSAAWSFPGSPLAATKEDLQELAGYWPDIEKSRAEARRLLKEAGAEGLTFDCSTGTRSAREISRPLGDRPVEQDRSQRDTASPADRPVVLGLARRQLRDLDRRQLPERCQSARRCQQIPAAVRSPSPITDISRSPIGRYIRPNAARTRQIEAARADAPIREARAQRRGPFDLSVVVAAHRAVPVLCQRLEDRSEPLC